MSAIREAAATIRSIVNQYQPVLSDDQRNTLIAMGIARAISMRLQLPTSPVPSIAMHFANSFDAAISKYVSEYNEYLILDVRLTTALIFQFYKFRYNLVFDCDAMGVALTKMGTAFPDIFPEKVTTVMTLELDQEDPGKLVSAWQGVVHSAAKAIEDHEANECNPPVNMAVL